MALNFDTTHEYHLGDGAELYYCTDHETLIVTRDHEDRLLINGVNKESMLKFARKLVQEDLEITLESYESKDAAKEPADVES